MKKPFYHVSHFSDGNMSYAYGEGDKVMSNRIEFFQRWDIPVRHVISAHVSPHTKITRVSKKDWGNGIFVPHDAVQADVLVTNEPGTFLFLNVADCLAIGFFDPTNGACALAHAGFYGVAAHVPKVAVEYLTGHFGSQPEDIHVFISPAIHGESCDFKDRGIFSGHDWDAYCTQTNKGTFCVDWIQYALDELIQEGIKTTHIRQSHSNTYTNHYFFSHHRQEEKPGIGLDEKGNHGVIVGWEP